MAAADGTSQIHTPTHTLCSEAIEYEKVKGLRHLKEIKQMPGKMFNTDKKQQCIFLFFFLDYHFIEVKDWSTSKFLLK